MLKVIIDEHSAKNLNVREGETNGRKWRIATQNAWVFKPNSLYPENFSLPLPNGAFAYPAGEYELDFESMLVRGAYDSPSISRSGFLLEPVNSTQENTNTQTKPLFKQPANA